MKCPKCDYLGFETGDRCRNCGYDFSLLIRPEFDAGEDLPLTASAIPAAEPLDPFDLPLSTDESRHIETGSLSSAGVDPQQEEHTEEDLPLSAAEAFSMPASAAAVRPADAPTVPVEPDDEAPGGRTAARHRAPALPLFTRPGYDDDAPLITVPPVPRVPLSVRKTPDVPRLRAVPKPPPRPAVEPSLSFAEVAAERAAPVGAREEHAHPALTTGHPPTSRVWRPPEPTADPGLPARRLAATILDHLILGFIDLVVVYFTLRILLMDFSAWRQLPPVPLIAFLLLIKLTYFWAFTAVGGQTIGKMAARIRVVADGATDLHVAQALRRTLFGALSTVAFGLGFVPGLFGERLALHDRAAGTRVVGLGRS